jgi:hypothetical protein
MFKNAALTVLRFPRRALTRLKMSLRDKTLNLAIRLRKRRLLMKLFLQLALLSEKLHSKLRPQQPQQSENDVSLQQESQEDENKIQVMEVEHDALGRAFDPLSGEFYKIIRTSEGAIVVRGEDDGDFCFIDPADGKFTRWSAPEEPTRLELN